MAEGLKLDVFRELLAYADFNIPVDACLVNPDGNAASEVGQVYLSTGERGLTTEGFSLPVIGADDVAGVRLSIPNSDRGIVIPLGNPQYLSAGDTATVDGVQINIG